MKNKKIKPITELRNTNEISSLCHESDEPIIITKNGYDDLVIMSTDAYKKVNKQTINENEFPSQSNCYGIIKVACATNNIHVACPSDNAKEIIKIINDSKALDLDILLFPELSITGYFCGDLFFQDSLINSTYNAIEEIRKNTIKNHTLIFVGAPIIYNDKIYNCALAMCDGKILGVVPKSNLPNYNEFYESRHFFEYHEENSTVIINGKLIPFGTKLIFSNKYQTKLKVACEICEDLWAVDTPSTHHSLAGANVIVNLSASNELYGKADNRRLLVQSASNRLNCAYMYCSLGNGESSQDLVYSAHNIIAENGLILKESKLFENEMIISEIDLEILDSQRRKNTSFRNIHTTDYKTIYFEKKLNIKPLTRYITPHPFLPLKEDEASKFAKSVIKLQVMGLVKRLNHINCHNVVLGLSGGLDSTLALIICYEAFKYLKLDIKGIHCISMPCFGTTSRTFNNAAKLAKIFNVSYQEIDIKEAVLLHLKTLKQDIENNNVAYENAQARERTQILFDYANKVNGLVIGTGDLSELALGWCTYNGDHMSNYAVNASVPKTLIKFLVKYYANEHKEALEVLYDILATPISPELLPSSNDELSQLTEEIIGPYELHDFFLYYLIKYNFSTEKIYYYAQKAFKDMYSKDEIKKWLNLFIKRFFNNQFKRSCMPDGPKVTEISLSPRGDNRMPSDATYKDFYLK